MPNKNLDHTCHVDCELEADIRADGTVRTSHMMYPADPNRSAGRYQAEQNLLMDRRAYRASGQDESRAVRLWNAQRRGLVPA